MRPEIRGKGAQPSTAVAERSAATREGPDSAARPSPAGVHDWHEARPPRLVVACSDGRIHTALDAWLHERFASDDADRLYIPGGPGVLVHGACDLFRGDRYRRELAFLVTAHATREIVFVFHGAADGGPSLAMCADYRRRLPVATADDIRAWQRRDAEAILRLFDIDRALRDIHPSFLFAEVGRDHRIRFDHRHDPPIQALRVR